MATRVPSPQSAPRLNGKYLLFGMLALVIAYVLVHNEVFLIQPANPIWQHYQPFKGYLLIHGLSGATVILIGPFQFSNRLRSRYRQAHRVAGRFYVAGAMILAPLGAFIQYVQENDGATRSFTLAGVIDAILLMTTTGIAFAFILARRIDMHRQWMTRSYCVAVVFLAVRAIGGITGLDDGPTHVETTVWICLPMSLLMADIILQVQSLKGRAPTS